MDAEVNLAWWPAWTSNPVVVHRKVGWVGSIPMHLRHFVFNNLNPQHSPIFAGFAVLTDGLPAPIGSYSI
jgi:hypothetical protein